MRVTCNYCVVVRPDQGLHHWCRMVSQPVSSHKHTEGVTLCDHSIPDRASQLLNVINNTECQKAPRLSDPTQGAGPSVPRKRVFSSCCKGSIHTPHSKLPGAVLSRTGGGIEGPQSGNQRQQHSMPGALGHVLSCTGKPSNGCWMQQHIQAPGR